MKINNYTVPMVVSLLQNYYKLQEVRFFKGDTTSSDILLDIDRLICEANLSDKQLYVIDKCWKEGFKQEEVSEKLGVSQQMIDKHIRSAKKKIEKVLISWEEV